LVVAILLAVPAYAAEAEESRGSNYFGHYSVYLCNISGSSFEAWFDVTGTGTMDVIGVSFIKIQQSTDGSNWTTVRTYTKESYPSLIDYNTTFHTAGVSYTATGGYYYRAFIQLYAKKGVNSAIMNEYTSKIYIPAN
jgi:hypothetical protein